MFCKLKTHIHHISPGVRCVSTSKLNATTACQALFVLLVSILMFLLKSHLLESYGMHGPHIFLKGAHNVNKHNQELKKMYLEVVKKKKDEKPKKRSCFNTWCWQHCVECLAKKKLLLLYTVAILLSFLIFLSSLSKFNQHFYLKGIMHPLELTSIKIL